MRRAYALALAGALALPLAGCRDSLVDPVPDPVEEPVPSVPSMYLKGPTSLAIDEVVQYRGEPLGEGVTYGWGTAESGPSEEPLVDSPDPSGSRVFRLRGLQPGRLTLVINAYRGGRIIASGRKVLTVEGYHRPN